MVLASVESFFLRVYYVAYILSFLHVPIAFLRSIRVHVFRGASRHFVFLFLEHLLGASRRRQVFESAFLVQLFYHYIQHQPRFLVIALFEGVELVVISFSVGIYFRVLVFVEDSSHGPLAINEPSIFNFKSSSSTAKGTSERVKLFFR